MKIRPAKIQEVGEVLQLIQDLATYEKAPEQVEASEEDLLNTIFASDPRVFCDLVEVDGQIAGMAIWFLNYSTWQAKHG
ncbi:MAG: GNAT family N-acetyltransferase, partial [Candidatus Nanopelagicaceae bacterium]